MKRPKPTPQGPGFARQCRTAAQAGALWALAALAARLLLPPAQTALPQGAALGWLALRVCVVTPLAEELAFRGGAMRLLLPLGETRAVVVQAVLFAALHPTWPARLYGLAMGLIFGWAARRAGSLWPCCGLHIINNCLVLAAQLAQKGAL